MPATSSVATLNPRASNAVTTAGSSMVGQNLGAARYKRVTHILLTVLCFGLAFASLASALMLLAPDFVYGRFTDDAEVLALAGVLTLPIILNFFGSATRSAAFSLINGSGRPGLNLAIAIIDGVFARIGLAALLGFSLGLSCRGFWLGDSLAGFMPFIIGGTYYLSGRWRK